MISIRWLEKRKPYWARLEELVQISGRGVSALSHRELQELGLLYRQTASDLAAVREDASSKQLALYLNQLLGRGHNLIYHGHKTKVSAIVRFYGVTYPQIFRQTLPQTLFATAIFFVCGIASWAVAAHDPGFAHRLLGPDMMETIERREMWTDSIVTIKPLASSGIMTNNLTVAFSAFAFGITAGLGTIWMMVFNGLLIGVIGAATWKAGMALQLWSFVAPHGVLELPAIFIAGGAGFEVARGMLFPGLLPRRQSLAQAGGRGARLFLGTIPLLIAAGVIEGFFSPSNAPIFMKFTLAAVLFAALLSYLFLVNRAPAKPAKASSAP
ncbi:MAG TPA: stage II sporulation protein M [Candidatus Acidoferrum sp.]|nr:stage II sporulation protein M [Candidatus Acidoferrum sp.]